MENQSALLNRIYNIIHPLKKRTILLLIMISACTLTACSHGEKSRHKNNGPKTYTVRVQQQESHLYYNGIIKPLRVVNVSSPVKGQVTEALFHFGEKVKKDQLLMTISSQALDTKYQQALSDYLKAKEDQASSREKWRGTQELNKLGLIAQNSFDQDMKNYEESILSFYQKRQKLYDTLKQTTNNADTLMKSLDKLSLKNVNAIIKALNTKQNQRRILAPAKGVVLFPVKSGGEVSTDFIVSGDPVKQGQVLLSIGDLTGFSIEISVNEVDVLKIKPKMTVIITGSAFPGVTLYGEIKRVDVEATIGDGGLPVFKVYIIVHHVTDEILQEVHVGMSAQVNITIKSKPQIRVPLDAVYQDNGVYKVKLKQHGKVTSVPVTPVENSTGVDSIQIKHGLKAGDVIVLPH